MQRYTPGLLACLLVAPLDAAEFVVLHTGFRIRAERTERVDSKIRLHTNEGVIELEAAQIAAFEPALDRATPPPPPAPEAAPVPLEPVAAVALSKAPRELVTEAALRHGLPPEFVHSVARAESAYRVDAVSAKGAIGVMQLMPGTARELNANPHDVEQNIEAGTRLLRDLLIKYQNEPDQVSRALAAYNAGPGAVAKYNGIPPYRETQAYVNKVLNSYWKQVDGAAKAANK